MRQKDGWKVWHICFSYSSSSIVSCIQLFRLSRFPSDPSCLSISNSCNVFWVVNLYVLVYSWCCYDYTYLLLFFVCIQLSHNIPCIPLLSEINTSTKLFRLYIKLLILLFFFLLFFLKNWNGVLCWFTCVRVYGYSMSYSSAICNLFAFKISVLQQVLIFNKLICSAKISLWSLCHYIIFL